MSPVLADISKRVLDTVYPPQCPACSAIVGEHGHLCIDCWRQIRFIGAPYCPSCGVPLDYDPGPGGTCVPCVQNPPAFAAARSVMLYDGFSRSLVLRFKHADRLDPAAVYAGWMVRAGRELLDDCDFIAPVPLHWTRLFARRYNQSALLAARIAAQTGIGHVPGLLERTRRTPSQGTLTRSRRARNVAGAFAVAEKESPRVKGAHIVLIDDVMTTGATASACAKALDRAGADRVSVLTLARVALPGDESI